VTPAMLPAFVVHADWSAHAGKRWLCAATLTDGVYRVSVPARVTDPSRLVRWAVTEARGNRALLGVDFPIGLPREYARIAGIHEFLESLPQFGSQQWPHFFDLAEKASQISVHRPFYPRCPGGTTQRQLVEGLGVFTMKELLRKCDPGNGDRNSACCVFWTLGGNQVGRAAISGWRDMLSPARRELRTEVGVWPFDGDMDELLAQRAATIVETYPAEACVQMGLGAPGRGWSKRDQNARARKGRGLRDQAQQLNADLTEIGALINDGFGNMSVGEDQFDAFVGLLAMLAVVRNGRADGAPRDPLVRSVEGWIFGQASAPSAAWLE
jgi:hypothetical protein